MKQVIALVSIIIIFFETDFAQINPDSKIEYDLRNGIINESQAILQKFYMGFAKEKVISKYLLASDSYRKCGTEFIIEYNKIKNHLDPKVVNEIESVIGFENRFNITASTYISPDGKFEITYETSGTNAVPTKDSNLNGIPDYVENIANYFDYSWRKLIDTMGYLPPPIGTGKYKVTFENMDYYGYTNTYSTTPKLTYIVMHNNFSGFPANDDPDGDQLGAAKVTAFHEFKHALQIVYNNWNDPGWFLEMDATWSEDIGFDQVNDYYNYLTSSHITQPGRTFESGSGYEDCLWLHFLSQSFGNTINKSIWQRRQVNGFEDIYLCFNNILANYSATFEHALTEYFAWNYLTGINSDKSVGYQEAAQYPSATICKNITSLPQSFSGCNREKLSANFIKIAGGNFTKKIVVSFAAASGLNNFAVVTKNSNGTISVDLNYAAKTSFDYLSNVNSSEISDITFIPVCISKGTTDYSYNITCDYFKPAIFTHTQLKDTETADERVVKTLLETPFNIVNKDSLKLYYRKENESYSNVNMISTATQNEFNAVIPNLGNEVSVNYYFQTSDSDGNKYSYPDNAPDTSFSYFVGTDIIAPSINLFEIKNEKSKYNLPLEIFTNINDNISVDSAFVEVDFKGATFKVPMQNITDDVYFAKVDISQESIISGDKLYYRIISRDISTMKNISAFPTDGFNSISFVEGFKFSSVPNLQIPDNNPISVRDTIEVEQDLLIGDIDIYLKATHNYPSDLEFRLKNPLGSTSYIISKPGLDQNLSAKNLDVILDEESFRSFQNIFLTDAGTIDGHFLPSGLDLNSLSGINAKGKWILLAYDKATGNTGTVNEWGLIIREKIPSDVSNTEISLEGYSINNYPNPFNPSTTITFAISVPSRISLKIYNSIGQLVKTIFDNKEFSSGTHNTIFDANGLSSGIYFGRIESKNFNKTIKLMLLR